MKPRADNRCTKTWQFSLQSMLGLSLIFASGVVLHAQEARAVAREERAFEELARRGFTIIVYKSRQGILSNVVYAGNVKLTCGTGVFRTFRDADGEVPFEEKDWSLFDEVSAVSAIHFMDMNVPKQRMAKLKAKFPTAIIDGNQLER